jgi:hypothetical protein
VKSLLSQFEGRLTAQIEDHRSAIKILAEAIVKEEQLLAKSLNDTKVSDEG